MGDTAGFVTIYAIQPRLLAVARLDTTASGREQATELTLPPSKKFRLYEKKTHANQVYKLSLSANYVALATAQEIELLDISHNKILWSYPIDTATPPVHSLDLRPDAREVLVSFASDVLPTTSDKSTSPLWLLQKQQDDSVTRTLVQPKLGKSLSLGTKCAAIWDKSLSGGILMLTLVEQRDGIVQQDLLRLSPTLKVIKRVQFPNKVPSVKPNSVEHISQSPQGHFTLLSTAKGIRLLLTESLDTLQLFGENIALHGHSLTFQQVFMIAKPTLPTEIPDFLTIQSEPIPEAEWINQQAAWIVGVPHATKGPGELKETLHLWEVWDGKHTNTTLVLPHKSQGFTSVVYEKERLIVSTLAGECYSMKAKLSSDFSGIMYPAGYQVITDNLEYIEDEDDLDVGAEEVVQEEEQEDDEIAEALRLSILEQQQEEDVDVMGGVDGDCGVIFPCHPEAYLKTRLENGESPAGESADNEVAVRTSFVSSILQPMPHANSLVVVKPKPMPEEPAIPKPPVRAKRNKAATVETLLRQSLNPDLRRIMLSKQNGCDGSRSRFHSESRDTATIAVVSPSEGSAEAAIIQLESSCKAFADLEPGTMDAAAALIMSACSPTKPSLHEFHSALQVTDPETDEQSSHVEEAASADATEKQMGIRVVSGKIDCPACRGRLLLHACGKKTRPVDYEKIMKAEKEKRDKEEDEKRKARAEKRRLADARRREARKKRKLEEEERLRREELERIRWEKERREEELARNRMYSDDKERRRVDMLQRLQAEQSAPVSDWPPPAQSYDKPPPDDSVPYKESYSRYEWPPPVQRYENSQRDEQAPNSDTYASDWPPAATNSDKAITVQSTSVRGAGDWPQPASQIAVTQSPSAYQDGEWPLPASTRRSEHETTSTSSLAYGGNGWPQPTHGQQRVHFASSFSATSGRDWPQPVQDHVNTGADLAISQEPESHGWPQQAETEIAGGKPESSVATASHAQIDTSQPETGGQTEDQPENFLDGTVATKSTIVESAATSEPVSAASSSGSTHYKSSYYTTTSAVTSDMLDPAEALASLAAFATAAMPAKVSEDYEESETVFDINPQTQAHYQERNEVEDTFASQEHMQQVSAGPKNQMNGWGNTSSQPEQTQEVGGI
jgi:hypothetical protein